jgi:hypothetical protein
MQVARRLRRDWCWKELGRTLFVLAPIIVVFSFWYTTTISHHDGKGIMMTNDSTVATPDLLERPKVSYTRVDDGADKQILLYVAVEQTKNGSQHPISIQRWAGLMAHEDVNYAQELALNLQVS